MWIVQLIKCKYHNGCQHDTTSPLLLGFVTAVWTACLSNWECLAHGIWRLPNTQASWTWARFIGYSASSFRANQTSNIQTLHSVALLIFPISGFTEILNTVGCHSWWTGKKKKAKYSFLSRKKRNKLWGKINQTPTRRGSIIAIHVQLLSAVEP